MFILFSILPLVAIGALVWGAITFTRRRSGAPFTIGTAIALYAHLLIIVGTVMALSGLATTVRAGLGYATLGYSYQSYAPPPPVLGREAILQEQRQRNLHQRDTDLVQGLTLAVIGALIVGAHIPIARRAQHLHAQNPAWTGRATIALLCVLCALVGLISAAQGVYRWLSYVVVAPEAGQAPDQFGQAAGLAVAFLPVWAGTLLWLLRTAHPATDVQIRPAGTDAG